MSTTVEHDGFSIESNHETEAAMQAALGVESSHAHDQAADGGEAVSTDRGAISESGETGVSGDDRGDDRGDGEAVGGSDRPADSGATERGTDGQIRKAKPRDNPQARISQAVAKQREAERKAAELEARLAAVEQQHQPPTDLRPAPTAPSGKPSWSAFEAQIGATYQSWGEAQDAYGDARDTWNRQQWQREQQEQQAREAQQQAGRTHLERVVAARKTYPDFDEALDAASDIRTTLALEQAILALPNSADAVYWLATHRDDFTQLASETAHLGVEAAPLVRRLLEARLGAGERSGSVPGAELSKAKPPVRPVGVSSVVVPDDPGDDEPFDAYFKRQNAIDRKKGRL